MGTTTFSGPIRAGDIRDTTGTTLGTNVRNVGNVVMVQTFPITQAGTQTALATSIVLPANSHILNIQMLTTTAWVTTTTVSVGTSATATELVSGASTAAIGLNALTPGTDGTRTANWDDTGTADKRIFVISGSGTGGVGTLTVRYIQAHDLA
tara:strand:- start:4092 stop:4547 length:456 start_codon:yes stop_codon:yes gene_type:complete